MSSVNVVVFGIGYVGLSNAVLLAQRNNVTAIDIISERVEMINNRKSPIADKEIIDFLESRDLSLSATLDASEACRNAEYVIIATPTNYDPDKDYFDTSSVEKAVDIVFKVNPNAFIVIKSTVPVGYTHHLRETYKTSNIVFSPEFLREGHALFDNLYPSRIIVGIPKNNLRISELAHKFASLLQDGALKENIPTLFMHSTEAEAVKLFANTYLAMRVSYFNELDMYAQANGLDATHIIEGMCLDSRIGKNYNNPSFGYGGYCLPKDTKQLLADYGKLPQVMIEAIVKSNDMRKQYIADEIEKFIKGIGADGKLIGIYRLTMKANSDNFRQASIVDVIRLLQEKGIHLAIYEPMLKEYQYMGAKVYNNLLEFKNEVAAIVANRYSDELNDVEEKVFTRDIYRED